MFIEELSPRNDYTRFIPDCLIDDAVLPEAVPSIMPYLRDQGMNLRQSLGFISGAMDLLNIVGEHKEGDERTSKWFKTSKVVDVRVLFRTSKNNPDRIIGSKVRLYSMGRPYRSKGDREEVQALDSGFLRFNLGSSDPSMVFQNALSSTMFFHSVYCLGGPATVRKVNIPAAEDETVPSYKWMSSVNPKWDENIDRSSYTHILHPALDAAGVERDFFSSNTLDDIVDVFTQSRDLEDMKKRLMNLRDEELDAEFVEEIIEYSNNDDANLDNADDFDSSPGLNVVSTLKFLYENLVEED